MATRPRYLIPSGVDPVDRLQGGLQLGSLYLVQGASTDTSPFVIRFMIEGLRRGDTAALVMSCSPEDAIRRFAVMGYDCLEDIYSGRLVILEYTQETVQQIAALSEFTPVLRELEWLLGETRPRRIVFDPITTVLARKDEHLPARARQFAEWAGNLGATVALTVGFEDLQVIDHVRPLVAESFKLEPLAGEGATTHRFVFENSSSIPPQNVEVDESRGIFVLDRAADPGGSPSGDASAAQLETEPGSMSAEQPLQPLATIELEAAAEGPLVDPEVTPQAPEPTPHLSAGPSSAEPSPADSAAAKIRAEAATAPTGAEANKEQHKFSEFLREMMTASMPEVDLAGPQSESEPAASEGAVKSAAGDTAVTVRPTKYSRAADAKIGAAKTARAAESLLRVPTDAAAFQELSVAQGKRTREQATSAEPDPGNLTILVVNDDRESSDAILQALGGYSLHFVHDGVSALARLISFKPDLVLLDVDLPIIDGFKVLEYIRSSLNVPVIVFSGSRVRASDRVLSSELGADYFLTKPFSAKELSNKARQLLARHRGINSWIVTGEPPANAPRGADKASRQTTDDSRFAAYDDFAAEVERRVEAAIEVGVPFSIVGCRLPHITSGGGRTALDLLEIVLELARDTDLTTTNSRNDFLILLPDAGASGARAFAGRLRARIVQQMRQEPSFWIRTFPESALAARAGGGVARQSEAQLLRRRASDDKPSQIGGLSGNAPKSPAVRAANTSL